MIWHEKDAKSVKDREITEITLCRMLLLLLRNKKEKDKAKEAR